MASIARARSELRKTALSLPGAWEDHPWGENVAKVGKKVFVFFGLADRTDLFVGVKLDRSRLFARTQPFVKEMGYGLGRSGWVQARIERGAVPLELLSEWILESYELVAPKKITRATTSPTRPRSSRRPKRRL